MPKWREKKQVPTNYVTAHLRSTSSFVLEWLAGQL
jgi:hypothetical protein